MWYIFAHVHEHTKSAVAKSEQCVIYLKYVCVFSCLSPTNLIRT
jgi:hypothetical protein